MMKRTFVSRNQEIWKKFYITYVRPHMQFAMSAWNPYLKKDISLLEKVQRRATRISPSIKNLSYEMRLEFLNLLFKQGVSVETSFKNLRLKKA